MFNNSICKTCWWYTPMDDEKCIYATEENDISRDDITKEIVDCKKYTKLKRKKEND